MFRTFVFVQAGFNPRTYIRYDPMMAEDFPVNFLFQSTYLYKVRLNSCFPYHIRKRFQSTYLYKVRHSYLFICFAFIDMFQSTYLYKVRHSMLDRRMLLLCFNPRTYIRYDLFFCQIFLISVLFQSTYLYKVRLCFRAI